MPFDAPFMLGPFSVDAEGRLAPRDPDALPAFLFCWRGRVIRARLRPGQPRHGRLLLRSVLGRVPSTGDSADPARRTQSFVALHWLPGSLPPHWHLSLLPDHRALLEAETEVTLPTTASGLLSELTGFLLALAPYLDVLDELGIGPSEVAGAGGRANTWPG